MKKTIVKAIMDKNFPELRNTGTQIHEAQRIPVEIGSNRKNLRYTVLKKTKNPNIEAEFEISKIEKKFTYKKIQ